MGKQIVRAFSGSDLVTTDTTLAMQIQTYAETNNLTIETLSYSVGKRGYVMVVFREGIA